MGVVETLVRSFIENNPEAAAHTLEGVPLAEAASLLGSLPHELVGPVIERLVPETAAAILEHLGIEYARGLTEAMDSRAAARVLQHLDEEHRESILQGLPSGKAGELRNRLRYPPETAGGIMTTPVTAIPVDLTVQEAIEVLRRARRETLYYLYVADREGKLIGVINMRELLLAAPRTPVRDLVRRQVLTVPASMDREEVVAQMRQRRFFALPVVDSEGRFLGVVKHEEALATVQEEAFEDLQRLVGAGADERALSPVTVVMRKRLPWLYVNLISAFLAATVVSTFEDVIAQVTALAILMPIVAGQGGNTGAQTLAVVIRGLALREILPGTVRWMLIKEVVAAALNGLAVATVTGIGVYLWSRNPVLSLIIGAAMVVNMMVAGLAGASIPLVLRALGRDPAQSSSIFLTMVTDVVGFASFLGLAMLTLPLLK